MSRIRNHFHHHHSVFQARSLPLLQATEEAHETQIALLREEQQAWEPELVAMEAFLTQYKTELERIHEEYRSELDRKAAAHLAELDLAAAEISRMTSEHEAEISRLAAEIQGLRGSGDAGSGDGDGVAASVGVAAGDGPAAGDGAEEYVPEARDLELAFEQLDELAAEVAAVERQHAEQVAIFLSVLKVQIVWHATLLGQLVFKEIAI